MTITLGFGDGMSKTERAGSGWDSERFRQFMKDISGTIGGPFTAGDLFTLAPRTTSLFAGTSYPELSGQNRPGGGFNLGFGMPPGYTGGGAGGGAGGGGGTGGGTGGSGGSGGSGGGTGTPKLFTQADILPAWDNGPEKRMDIPRFFRQSGLDPNGFTLQDFQNAVAKAKSFGFSGRSLGNLGAAASLRQDIGTTGGQFGGGREAGCSKLCHRLNTDHEDQDHTAGCQLHPAATRLDARGGRPVRHLC